MYRSPRTGQESGISVSTLVCKSSSAGRRSQLYVHIAAYYTQEGVNNLRTIDSIPGVGDIPVPNDLYRTTRKASKSNKSNEDYDPRTGIPGDGSSSPMASRSLPPTSPTSSYSPVSPNYVYHPHISTHSSSTGYSDSSSTSEPSASPNRAGRPGAYRDNVFYEGRGLVPLQTLEDSSPKAGRDPMSEGQLRRLSWRPWN